MTSGRSSSTRVTPTPAHVGKFEAEDLAGTVLRVDKALDDPRSAESLRVALGVLAKVGTLEARATTAAPLDDLNECIREIALAVEAAARVIAVGLVDPPPDVLEAFKKAVGAAEGALDVSGNSYSELVDPGVPMPARALEF
jgi:hypothetical protein